MNNNTENPKNQRKAVEIYRLGLMASQDAVPFCSFLIEYGASFYTMRDKLVYGNRLFDPWERKGIQKMIADFAPDYRGKPQDFFGALDCKERFVAYMVEKGGMGRTSCYTRFKAFNFRHWEILGLDSLYEKFLQLHRRP